MDTNEWYLLKDRNLAQYMRQAGFDLSVYQFYSEAVAKEARRLAIKEMMYSLKYDFEEYYGEDLKGIKKGLYVISLSYPLSIKYRFRSSQVLYIGMGAILQRIEQHLNNSLFDFMESLSGANFDFAFALPSSEADNYHKHVEYEMLEYFSERYGGMDDKRRFPLLNKNAGSNKSLDGDGRWWSRPLKATGKKPLWAIEPTQHSDFAPLD